MKNHDTQTPIDRPINALRRTLLLGFPGGLVMSTPLVLLGCGDSDEPVAEARNPLLDLPPGEVSATATRVTIEMPGNVAMAAAQVTSASGSTPVTANEAMVDVYADGPQLATVFAADGTPLLMGWIGPGRAPISVQSTAVVLLHFGLGLPFFGPDTRDMLRRRLETHPAVAAFGTRIAEILAVDPRALSTASPALLDAFDQAAQRLLPAPTAAAAVHDRMRALGLKVEPAASLSGLQVVQGDTLNSFFVDNQFVRRAVVVVNREAWVDSDGVRHVEPQAPVQVGEVMELPLPAAVDSVSNVVAGWANEFYAPDDPNGFFRSVSETLTLDIAPADAKRTEYSVVVLMAGELPVADIAAFNRLPASQKAYVRGLDITRNLLLKAVLNDLLGPLFFGLLAEKLGEFAKGKGASEARKELMTQFAATLFTVLQTQVPDVIQKLSDGSTDAWTAFKTICKAMTFDPNTGAMSPLLQEGLSKLAEFCVVRLADAKLRSAMLEVATGVKIGGKGVLGILPVLKIIAKFDEGMGYLALLRIVADIKRSRQMESWSVVATKAKVVLRPNPVEVEPTGVTYPVTVEIVDNDDDAYGVELGSISFDWECTGLYGTLYSPVADLANPNHFTTSKNNATANYIPKGVEADAAPETIEVRAYFEPIGSSGAKQLIGSATTTLKFKKRFNLKMSPSTAELPTEGQLGITAWVIETLPAEASVRYEWKLRSGGGALNVTNADSDTARSAVDYLAPADETTAVVEVVAVIVPGAALATIRTDPVAATIAVKKGLKTVTVEGTWRLEPGSKPLAEPSCFVSNASGIRSCLLGYLDSWVVYIVPKVANAKSYTITIYDAQGGARYTYEVPLRHPIGGPNIQDGGSSLRIPYWAANGPYGSNDGVSNYDTVQAGGCGYIVWRAQTDGPRVVAVVTLNP